MKPITVENLQYADEVRIGKKRQFGSCKQLINTSPNISAGENVRKGYAEFTHTPPEGLDIMKIAPIQNPSQEDVKIYFADSKVYMSPYWNPDRNAGNVELGESKSFTPTEINYEVGVKTLTILNAGTTYGLSTVNDYYNNWVLKRQTNYLLITDYSYTAGTAVFTFFENPVELSWTGVYEITLQRYFHDNVGFAPTYNNNKTSPPCVSSGTNVIRFSGGVGSSANLRGVRIDPKLDKTFFPSEDSGYNFKGTYISERECKAVDIKTLLGFTNNATNRISNPSFENYVGIINDGVTDSFTPWSIYNPDTPDGIFEAFTLDKQTGNSCLKMYSTDAGVDVLSSIYQTISIDSTVDTGLSFYYKSEELVAVTNTIFVAIKNTANDYYYNFSTGLWAADYTGKSYAGTNNVWTKVTETIQNLTGINQILLIIYPFGNSNINKVKLLDSVFFGNLDESTINALPAGFTYWLAVAPVYDGTQIGKLTKYETTSGYTSDIGTENYISAENLKLIPTYSVSLGSLNKRITGFVEYIAKDLGDTRSKGRQTPYYFVKYIPITDTSFTDWVWDIPTQKFRISLNIDGIDVGRALNSTTYQVDSGIIETPTDIMYSYSSENMIAGRRFLSNVYMASTSETNREEIFTNPLGGNPDLNAGIIAEDVFSNEEAVFRHKVQPETGDRIQAIVPTGINEILVIKNLGIAVGRIYTIDQQIEIGWETLSTEVGLTTLNEYCKDNHGWIYFPDYNDVYRYKSGTLQKLIEREDFNDWLYTYRDMDVLDKESATVWYMPEKVCFNFGNRDDNTTYNDLQYDLYLDKGWRQVRYGQNRVTMKSGISFKWISRLQDGTVLGVDNYGAVYQFGDYKLDDDLDIIPYIDTGHFLPTQNESQEFILHKVTFNRTLDEDSQGIISVDLFLDGHWLRHYIFSGNENRRFSMSPYSDQKRVCSTMRFVYNANGDRERLDTGTMLRLDSIELYGNVRPRSNTEPVNYNTLGEDDVEHGIDIGV
jgi:hypothetical protein